MKRFCLALSTVFVVCAIGRANGLLLPKDAAVQPLAMVAHHVSVEIDEQTATTTVEQTFRNHTSRIQEAIYVFSVPKGASVNKFSMWIGGVETAGEILEAKKAKQIYTDIVRRTQDPALLEWIGTDLLQMRVFPIPAHGEQKVKVKYLSITQKDQSLIEYVYPLRTDAIANRSLEAFSLNVSLKSAQPIVNVYSPTHAVRVDRVGDRTAKVVFEKLQQSADRDFQLFYGLGKNEVGITPILYRPISSEDGYFMFLISPRTDAGEMKVPPRDLVMVLDKSGSMSDAKMAQAKKALQYCLSKLRPEDRFGIVSFATTVENYRDELVAGSPEQIELATKWIQDVRQSGGTAILPALKSALQLRSTDSSRTCSIVFFTDGVPTIDETNPDRIVKTVVEQSNANTRIFTFGVGDDVNAAMLDRLAESTRAASTYVRPTEDLEVKVSGLHDKISLPALTNLRLSASGITLKEIYPVRLPDLFHGGQLVVMGRYSGSGESVVRLSGQVGSQTRELVEEFNFPTKTSEGKEFVEALWARRKVAYLLDQVRTNGEQPELVAEVVRLAKKYGIATPYTSYLVVPDGPMPIAGRGRPTLHPGGFAGRSSGANAPPGVGFGGSNAAAPPKPVTQSIAKAVEEKRDADGLGNARGETQKRELQEALKSDKAAGERETLNRAQAAQTNLEAARKNYADGKLIGNQTGTLGVELAIASANLRNQQQLTPTATRLANGRQCIEVSGVWIDQAYDAKMKIVAVKAQSNAYFKILDQEPLMKEVYRLGNYVLWVTPSGQALAIDTNDGRDQLSDVEIRELFTKK